ncbi:MAG: sigma-54 dependent transcriptional regulator, partial [Desulfobacterales bacterium]|nr:sigma-54 dependent transcriptional regulator [Desulfobacterales bacterium]
MTARILIVDDEKDMLNVLKRIISEKRNYSVTIEPDPIIALELFMKEPFDLVITDLKMPGMDGITLLEEVKKISPGTSVFVMTAYGTIETAVDAIKKGAYDYITKPFMSEHVLLTIDKAVKWRQMVKENLALRQALEEKEGYLPMIGTSPAIMEVFEHIRQVAPSMATVLITGPSGTGKELVAGAIHRNSRRSSKAMITVNCTAIPEQIMESELFGHVKGAFTGAWRDKKGMVEEAQEGTLFLDEIADLSPFMQTKLLRLLQDGEYKPVGGVFTKKADIRIIAATNHDINQDVKEKRFREDLYYRLNVVHIELPPLSKRKEDIPLLAYHFMEKYARINQKDIREISAPAMQALLLNE